MIKIIKVAKHKQHQVENAKVGTRNFQIWMIIQVVDVTGMKVKIQVGLVFANIMEMSVDGEK